MPPQPRGTKRKLAATPSGEDAEATCSNGAPAKAPASRKRTASTKKPALKRQKSSAITTDIPWPAHFKDLERVFKALNLVYTFCCCRKHFATTFSNIKATVEGHTKKELTVSDIAQIKLLLPNAVHFEYVNEEMLQIYLADANPELKKDEQYRVMGRDPIAEVLLFEFVDGDLKRSVIRRVNEAQTPAYRKLKNEDLKMPTYSQAQMMKLINKRNEKFESAINGYLNDCRESGVDAVESIKNRYQPHLPQKREDADGVTDELDVKSTLPSTIPKERKSIIAIVEELKASELYMDQIVENGHRVFSAQEPIYGDLDYRLSQSLIDALYTAHNITKFYSHQAEAINNLHSGHHVIVSTSTSSGKTLVYQVPVLHELEQNRDAKSMFIFPTKALAQDQKRSLNEVLGYMRKALGHVQVDTFDGDSPHEDRQRIREEASVIFTNPDMLHLNILPNEVYWRGFLKNLRFVVVDELHVYNGIFGSHVAFVMRRLRRICAALGNNDVSFVSCSATVANPEKHMSTLFDLPLTSIKLTDEDGSPSGQKHFICWNTPYKDHLDPTSGRGDAIVESAKLLSQLILRGVRTIAFCKVRKACEAMISAVRSELNRLERPEVASRVMAYRGGYSPQDRRNIEKEMFSGSLVGIVATSALELGVDIGSLDAVIMVGFPWHIANLRQQSGRAGRRNKDSLSVLIGDSYPGDQHYMAHPDEIFTKPNTELAVDLENILIREGHLQCAAHEMPINPEVDKTYFGDDLVEVAMTRLDRDDTGFFHTNRRFLPYPSKFVQIRDCEDDSIAVIDVTNSRNVVLEEVEMSRTFFTLYEGGIFLHQGMKYLVKTFSPERKLAEIERVNVDWTTAQRDFTDVDPVETELIKDLQPSQTLTPTDAPGKAFFGTIKITTVVFGFFKLDRHRRILDAVEVDNPPLTITAKGFWLDIPVRALDILNRRLLNPAAAIHAAEHALMSLIPGFLAGSTESEVRTECKAAEKEFMKRETSRKRPARLVFYDSKGGACGSGICRRAFEFCEKLLERALERVESCTCCEGCPECVAGLQCKEGMAVMSKAGAGVVLRCVLGLEVDVDSLPMGEEAGIETVVPAVMVGCKRKNIEQETEGLSRFVNSIVD